MIRSEYLVQWACVLALVGTSACAAGPDDTSGINADDVPGSAPSSGPTEESEVATSAQAVTGMTFSHGSCSGRRYEMNGNFWGMAIRQGNIVDAAMFKKTYTDGTTYPGWFGNPNGGSPIPSSGVASCYYSGGYAMKGLVGRMGDRVVSLGFRCGSWVNEWISETPINLVQRTEGVAFDDRCTANNIIKRVVVYVDSWYWGDALSGIQFVCGPWDDYL